MEKDADGYGNQLAAQFQSRTLTAEIIERDDNYIDFGSDAGTYFTEYEQWSSIEQTAINRAAGRILDIGCGAGRHALHLQRQGFDVTGIDNSPGAIGVCRARGLKKALVRPVNEIDRFAPDSFDTILMFGNNFGLFGGSDSAKMLLKKMSRITASNARIIAGTRNPYQTDDSDHLEYHELNRQRGRMSGQIRMRVRYRKIIGEWFDYLFVSPEEMQEIISDTDWQIEEFIEPDQAQYFAVIGKR